ncbi:MAG: recombinase family protein [Eubacterium sp.]|nr:recombinase family protein [Eubacterium sp.]
MGRISKRKAAGEAGTADAAPCGKKNGKKYRAGIYARLSSDLDKDKNESIDVQASIARNFVEEFNREHDEWIEIAECYSDLGKTGSNFNRDGFLRMMQDIRLGEINCVIVKDLSRFGRNYLEAGNYIEKIFPFLGVRFIAVSDGLDTGINGSGADGITSEIKNLVNDMYAKDFSVKAKTWLQQKRQAGSYVGGPPPYGYTSVWEKKIRKLVPDGNTAGIVRFIFTAFVEKESFTAVADELNRRKVNPPAVYKMTGEVYCPAEAQYKKWDKGAIERMVGSRTYAGMLVQGKTSKTARDEKNRVHKPEGEWIVKKNAHEALVSTELFESAQEICARIRERSASCRHPAQGLPIGENIFDAVLYCGVCGRKMTRSSPVKEYADGTRERKEWYFCLDGGQKKNGDCPQTNRISRQELTEILISVLQTEFAVYLKKPGHFSKIGKEQLQEAGARIEREIKSVQAAAGRMDEEEAAIYMDYRAGNVAQEEYVDHKLKNEARRQELESREEDLRKRMKAVEKVKGRYLKAVRSLTALKSRGELTAEIISALVEKIYVYPGRRAEIQFRYTNEMLKGVV